MNWRVAIFVFVFVLLGLKGARADEVISTTKCRFNGGRQKVTIEIVMTEGRFYDDKSGWCGGDEKWEGQFEIRVRKGQRLLSKASLNQLLSPKNPSDSLFFWSPKFKLALRDYNGDGRLDFNLGQYGSCVGNNYRLFTIRRDGTIAGLPCAGNEEGLEVGFQTRVNSTPDITARHGRVTCTSYERSPERSGSVTEQWLWKSGRFVLVRRNAD